MGAEHGGWGQRVREREQHVRKLGGDRKQCTFEDLKEMGLTEAQDAITDQR